MASEHAHIFRELARPFDPVNEVRMKPVGHNRNAPYITARHVMNRLDDVVGPENWFDEYTPCGADSYHGKLSIRLPDGRVITKQDCGGKAGMKSEEDDEKSGVSDCLKRMGAKFGIGRYLYGDGEADLESAAAPPEKVPPGAAQPTSGKALWAWCKEASGRYSLDLCQKLWTIKAEMGETRRVLDWDVSTVADAYSRLAAYLASLGKLELPPEAQVHPVGGKAPARDPLHIETGDPLRHLKERVLYLSAEVVHRWNGTLGVPGIQLDPVEVMETIRKVSADRRQSKIDSIRDCRSSSNLHAAIQALEEEVNQLVQVQEAGL